MLKKSTVKNKINNAFIYRGLVTLNSPRLVNLRPSKHNLTNVISILIKTLKKLFTMSRYKKIIQ